MSSEDEKQLSELQDRMLVGTQALARLQQQERIAQTRKTRAELTLSELQALPADTRTYKSVGKAYFLSTQPDVVAETQRVISECSSEVQGLRTQRGVVQQKLKEAETELRELVQGNPGIARQFQNVRVS